jgi:hypothetical protein
VQNISLEDGQGLQDFAGNFVTINKYLFKFWQPILDDAAFIIYLKMREMLYGGTHTYPTTDQIAVWCGKSDRTVQRNMPQLEEYELVEKVMTFKKKGGSQHVNLYFVRRSTPFLPIKGYKKLSPELKKHHDEYLMDLVKSKFIVASQIPNYEQGMLVAISPDNVSGGDLSPSDTLSGDVDNRSDNLSGPSESSIDTLSPGSDRHPGDDNLSGLGASDCRPNNTEFNNTGLNQLNNSIITQMKLFISE